MKNASALSGALLGTAVGDAIGLPFEGLSAARAKRIFGDVDRHHLLFGRGMVSDDTEHACMTVQALMVSGYDPEAFGRDLARRFRWWMAGLPAGVGFATLRAILKLWAGISPRRSGVRSAGNGPAMRAPVIGAAARSIEELVALTGISTRITHRSGMAEAGALAVALGAFLASRDRFVDGQHFLLEWRRITPVSAEMANFLTKAVESAERGESAQDFANSLGLLQGVTGYVLHTVPVAIQVWLRNQQDLAKGVSESVALGGDTDTVAAITGGLIGAGTGVEGIPVEWLDGLIEWPRTVNWMKQLAQASAEALYAGQKKKAPGLPVPGVLLRNLVFLGVVLSHGFRRLFPPY